MRRASSPKWAWATSRLFGVSRIPVREALIALAHAGVISMTPHRGAFDAVARGLVGLVPGNFFVEVVGAAEITRRQLPLVADSLEAGRADAAAGHYAAMLHEQGKLVVDRLRENGALVDQEEGP